MLLILVRRVKIFNIQIKRTTVDLAYKIEGNCSPQSTPLIILHGLLGSKRNWFSMSKNIAQALNTCAVAADARNHGESPHDSSHSYLDLASDVSKLMDNLNFRKASIIGHSMGGRTAMALALSEPNKVERVVVVDISPVSSFGLQTSIFPRLIEVMKSINFDGINNLSQARSLAKDQILKSGVIKQIEGMHFVLMNLAENPDKTIRWVINMDALKNNFQDIATFPSKLLNKQFDGPTLFIGGEESQYIPQSDLEGIKKLFPKAELKYVPGVGHNVHAEDPKTFLKLTTEFLS